MKFYINEAIEFPFTVYYYGYKTDLGPSPDIFVNLFSLSENKLLDIPIFLNIKSIDQVANDTLISGVAYVNKIHNNLTEGEYRLKISLKKSGSIIDLLYAPIQMEARQNPFYVYTGDSEIPSNYLKGVVPSGVRTGFTITRNANSYVYDIGIGTLFTEEGVKIELLSKMVSAFRLAPAVSSPRIDTVCLYYNPEESDELGARPEPSIVVLKGLEDDSMTLASVPPHHNRIAYANIPVGSPAGIAFSMCRSAVRSRPFYGIPAVLQGDGVRSTFEFPIEVVKDTAVVEIDGLPQRLGTDYDMPMTVLGRTVIKFIDEVPQLTQRVTLSGSTPIGEFYPIPGVTTQSIPVLDVPATDYTKVGLVAEFNPESLSFGKWDDISNNYVGFTQSILSETLLRGWEGTYGNYVHLDGLRWMSGPGNMITTNEWTIVLKLGLRDMPDSNYWRRFIVKGSSATPQFSLMIRKNSSPIIRAQFGDNSTYAELNSENAFESPGIDLPWSHDQAIIVVSKTSSNSIVLRYGGKVATAAVSPTIWDATPWAIGRDMYIGTTSAAYGKIYKLLAYSRVLPVEELSKF